MKDIHDGIMTPVLREEIRMHSIIASLDQLTPEEREEMIQHSKKVLATYRHLIEMDPELKKIL